MWCGTIRSLLEWPLRWNLWDFYPQPAVAFTGNKAMNSIFLPTATPHGTRTLYRIDYRSCHTCAVWVWSLERARAHTHTLPLIRLLVDLWLSVHVSETLCTLWTLSNPFNIGLTWRWSRPWHYSYTLPLHPSTLLLIPPLVLVRLNLNKDEINNW